MQDCEIWRDICMLYYDFAETIATESSDSETQRFYA